MIPLMLSQILSDLSPVHWYINGLVQERHNSIADALELCLSRTNLSISDALEHRPDVMWCHCNANWAYPSASPYGLTWLILFDHRSFFKIKGFNTITEKWCHQDANFVVTVMSIINIYGVINDDKVDSLFQEMALKRNKTKTKP